MATFVDVYHPELDARARVAESAVAHMRDKGWQLADADPDADQLYAPADVPADEPDETETEEV